MGDFFDRLKMIDDNLDQSRKFTSNAASNNKRVFNLFNSNIKNLSTYIEYNSDLILSMVNPSIDIHQKKGILDKLNINPKSKSINYRLRSQLLEASKIYLKGTNNLARILLVFILSLDTKFYKPIDKAQYLWGMLPEPIWAHYNDYLKKIVTTTDSPFNNPLYMFFVLYSDLDLLDEYLQIIEMRDLTSSELNHLKSSRSISKRISDCQIATFKYEALLGQIYRILSEVEKEDCTYEDIINNIIKNICNLVEVLGKENIVLFTYDDFYNGKLSDFLLNIADDYKQIIMNCLGCSIIAHKIAISDKNILNNSEDFKEDSSLVGEDEARQCKVRKNHNKFKDRLAKRYPHKCLICDIVGIKYLKASHIVRWADSTPAQKVSSANGFLMCPQHDFLFDTYLISFDEAGKILIRKDFPTALYPLFNINKEIKISISQDVEENLKEHRIIFRRMDI